MKNLTVNNCSVKIVLLIVPGGMKMSRSYFNEFQKTVRFERIPWTWDEQDIIKNILNNKGYPTQIVTRLGCDRQPHDTLYVQRKDVPRLVEQCFRQRFHVEVQAEGQGKAAIIFVYDNRATEVIR